MSSPTPPPPPASPAPQEPLAYLTADEMAPAVSQHLLRERLAAARAENAGLISAINKHHSQKADDLCWMDDNELYVAAGLPPRDNIVGDPDAMLKNCRRFIEQRCKGGGSWKSYAELEAENAGLREDAERWRKLIDCERIRVIGSARLGRPDGHIGLELWGQYPGRPTRQLGADDLTHFADGLALAARQRTEGT